MNCEEMVLNIAYVHTSNTTSEMPAGIQQQDTYESMNKINLLVKRNVWRTEWIKIAKQQLLCIVLTLLHGTYVLALYCMGNPWENSLGTTEQWKSNRSAITNFCWPATVTMWLASLSIGFHAWTYVIRF